MKISEVLKPDKIICQLKSKNKDEVIEELLNLFKDDERILDFDDVKSAVMEREKIMSTGVGSGLGIPHCKTNKVNGIITAFGKSDNPINYQALDGKPVYLVFLLIGRDNLIAPQIKLLSRISLIMNKELFREKIKLSNTAEEIYNLFVEEEKNLP